MNMAGRIVMFDTSNPEKPRVLDVLDLVANSGPHYIALTSDESRLVISDYFLNEDDAGKVRRSSRARRPSDEPEPTSACSYIF